MKVIAVTAAYNDEATLAEFLRHINQLNPGVAYHIFVTNNVTDKTDEIIDAHLKFYPGERISYNLDVDYTQKHNDPYCALALAWQKGLETAREKMAEDEEITHILYLDSDIFILDTDALNKAARWRRPIVGGSYLRDFPEGRALASVFLITDEIQRLLPDMDLILNAPTRFNTIFYNCVPVLYTSAGFMLMERKAAMDERLRFSPIHKMAYDGGYRKETSPEFGMQELARRAGYVTYLDGTIKLSHYVGARHRAWRDDGSGGYIKFAYDKEVEV